METALISVVVRLHDEERVVFPADLLRVTHIAEDGPYAWELQVNCPICKEWHTMEIEAPEYVSDDD